MAFYPNALKVFTTKLKGEKVLSSHMNEAQEEIAAVEGELGLLPKGSKATVRARLDDVDTRITPVKIQSITYGTIARAALAAGYTTFGNDDTIPQITEGVEVGTLLVTPLSATSQLVFIINLSIFQDVAGASEGVVLSLFKAGTSNAIQTFIGQNSSTAGYRGFQGDLTFKVASHGIAAKTYSIRASLVDGANGAIDVNKMMTGAQDRYGVTTTPFICKEYE